ncbi:hypothetical protein QE243_06820, partial [Klebsiella pneumoniae]
MCEYNQFGQALGVALPDWQPRPWPTRQVLQGSRCRLEPLTLAHASDLFAAHQLAPDARSWTWLLREPESNLAEFSAWVAPPRHRTMRIPSASPSLKTISEV